MIVAIFLSTFLVFACSARNGFVAIDDPLYITDNFNVQAGLKWQTVLWAFKNVDAFNWHPLTWLSIALDCQFFGLDPGVHHLVSVGIHAADAALFYLLLFVQITELARLPSPRATAFAWHPLRVESVVWAAERKDVLATFFLLLTVLSYLRYVRCPVSFPTGFVRLSSSSGSVPSRFSRCCRFCYCCSTTGRCAGSRCCLSHAARAVLEKLPLFAIAIAASLVAVFAAGHGRSGNSLRRL